MGFTSTCSSTGSSTAEPGGLAVTRSGNSFISYVSADGANWVQLGASQTISMATNIYVGLAASSGSSSMATATFDNVSITNP